MHRKFGIKLRTSAAQDLIHRTPRRSPRCVRTVRTDRIKRVCDGDDPRHQWNRISLQPIGIALTVPSLVMAANTTLGKVQLIEGANQACSSLRMTTDDTQLFTRQPTGLEENLIWNGQLPEIVDHRSGVNLLDLALIESDMCGKRCRE